MREVLLFAGELGRFPSENELRDVKIAFWGPSKAASKPME